jgi:hypothetical protein
VLFQYFIGNSDLGRVDVIIDLGVLIDSRMTSINHIELILSKSARMLGFIKRISREFNELYVAFVRPGLEFASCGHLIKRFIHRELSAFNTTL